GQANGWMTRSQHLWSITLLGFGLPALVIGICFCIRFLPASMLNVPKAAFWRSRERYPEACRILLDWSFLFGAISFIWTAILNYQLVSANQLIPPHLAPIPVFILSGIYIAVTGIMVVFLVLRFTKTKNS
ncbi:MAG: hypothetical protein L0220_04090, partial [Acidobacteria bacterium]|nr:hypothetical protein [Acidobacteriota bacterium]